MSTQSKKKKGFLSDTVFKYFIKKEEYRNWFYEIIKEKTGIDLNLYELYDNEANSGNKKKDYRMDAVFRGSESTVIIEVNNGNAKMSEIKMYFYLHRVQGDYLEEGEKYRPYRTTLIAFNNYRNPKTLI